MYNQRPEEDSDWIGDEYDTLAFGSAEGYRNGVDQVLTYIESIHRYDTLLSELRWAIKEGII